MREESLRAKISLPMVMQVMFVAGRNGVTFCLIHVKALEGSFILERYSLPSPTMNSTPVPENALRISGFASYSFTFVAPIDFTSGTTSSGDGRLSPI